MEWRAAKILEILLSNIGYGRGSAVANEVFEGLGWLTAMDAPTINIHAGIDFVLLVPEGANSEGNGVLSVSGIS